MRSILYISILLCTIPVIGRGQSYVPPSQGTSWDTISPASLGWCETQVQELYSFLDQENTKAFILLKEGKIVLEQYFNGHTATTNWYWASAGKTLTAFITGVAQAENQLSLSAPTSTYLGQGWTDIAAEKENEITIWHQLTMTSGLDDGVVDPFCTADSCLQYLTDAGARWAYHNAPYTLLLHAIEAATDRPINRYVSQHLHEKTGMDGGYIMQGYNSLFISTARSMARFGLLVLRQGWWGDTAVLDDSLFVQQMISSSQEFNPSYGYLWWLNGKDRFMLPNTQQMFTGPISPHAPDDMIAAMGKNGQFINVVPSQNLVWIRMGDSPQNTLAPYTLNDEIWSYINQLECPSSARGDVYSPQLRVSPNPATTEIILSIPPNETLSRLTLFNMNGQATSLPATSHCVSVASLESGMYIIEATFESGAISRTLFVRQ